MLDNANKDNTINDCWLIMKDNGRNNSSQVVLFNGSWWLLIDTCHGDDDQSSTTDPLGMTAEKSSLSLIVVLPQWFRSTISRRNDLWGSPWWPYLCENLPSKWWAFNHWYLQSLRIIYHCEPIIFLHLPSTPLTTPYPPLSIIINNYQAITKHCLTI